VKLYIALQIMHIAFLNPKIEFGKEP
jgi:hypothetical protein